MTDSLGRLQRVELREAWLREDSDFTPWLAQEENIALLAEALGIAELEVEGTEQKVGPYRADILCKDLSTEAWVLVENQLEKTDHSHLGQLITYAAGLDTVSIVWVAQKFTEEHRAALDWLNSVTEEGVNFFGLEVELWRIGNSPMAPKFNVVSKPNDWVRTAAKARSEAEGDLSPVKQRQVEFWDALDAWFAERGHHYAGRTSLPFSYTYYSLGATDVQLVISTHSRDQWIKVSVITRRRKEHVYKAFQARRQEIESTVGTEFDWQEYPRPTECEFGITRNGFDLNEPASWSAAIDWAGDLAVKLDKVLRPIVKVAKDNAKQVEQ